MTITLNETNSAVENATEMANGLLNNDHFLAQIAAHPSFDLSTATPAIIADLMRNSNIEVTVEFFHPNFLQSLKKYKNTFAFTEGKHTFLNDRKLNRSVESIAATILHEAIHVLDNAETEYTFGHGNNSSVGKQNTAPYWIGNLAYKTLTNNPQAPLLVFDEAEEEIQVA